MEKVLRVLEHHVVQYLIIFVLAVAAAVLFFEIGGSFAHVTGQQDNPTLKLTFEAGGGLAGFILVLLLSVWVIGKLRNLDQRERTFRAQSMAEQQRLADDQQTLLKQAQDKEKNLIKELTERERALRQELERRYSPTNDPLTLLLYFRCTPKLSKSLAYKCICTLYNEDTGTQMVFENAIYWEAGFLATTVKGVGRNEYLAARLEAGDKVWLCDRFHASERRVDVKMLPA